MEPSQLRAPTKEPAPGRYGTPILGLVVVALALAFYLASRAEPSDSRLLDSLADNRPEAEALASGLLQENPDPMRIAAGDLRADRRLLAEEMGLSSILVRDGLVWLEYETDTAMPWIRVDEPTKSLVFTSGSPVPYAAATLGETFDYNFDPGLSATGSDLDPRPTATAASLVVCRQLDASWAICLDRNG